MTFKNRRAFCVAAPLLACVLLSCAGTEQPLAVEPTAITHVPPPLVIPGLARDSTPPGPSACATQPVPVTWPSSRARPEQSYRALLDAALARYDEYGIAYATQLQDYAPGSDYLNYGATLAHDRDPTITWSSDGIPLVEYDGARYENPVTAFQYALALHGRSVRGTGTADAFVTVAERMLARQSLDGAFRFPFPYTNYLTGDVLEPGWTSGMAQGLALSVFSRAHRLTGDDRFLSAGALALEFLQVPVSRGGVAHSLAAIDPRLADHLWFAEYPWPTAIYTLNGFGYTLLGLLDWSHLEAPTAAPGTTLAGQLYRCGIASLLSIISIYDVGGFTAYDLGHYIYDTPPNLQVYYHAFHISQFHALTTLPGSGELKDWVDRWRNTVDTY